MDKDELAKKLLETSYLEGDFTLRSGRKSHYLIDKYGFETCPQLLAEIARALARLLPQDVDRLAGVELGGVPLATALSLESGLPFVIVKKGKKGYGTDKRIEGRLVPGEHIVLVEDVVTTAGTACAAVAALREAGAGKVTVLVVVDRQEGAEEGFREAGIPYRALFTRQSLGIGED